MLQSVTMIQIVISEDAWCCWRWCLDEIRIRMCLKKKTNEAEERGDTDIHSNYYTLHSEFSDITTHTHTHKDVG
jgi:ABC-type nickel/cobalt efflux system permease component RcnA